MLPVTIVSSIAADRRHFVISTKLITRGLIPAAGVALAALINDFTTSYFPFTDQSPSLLNLMLIAVFAAAMLYCVLYATIAAYAETIAGNKFYSDLQVRSMVNEQKDYASSYLFYMMLSGAALCDTIARYMF